MKSCYTNSIFILYSLMLAILLAALDQTIVATALPKISSEFNASDEIGWVSSC
jgi:hypothetical protein